MCIVSYSPAELASSKTAMHSKVSRSSNNSQQQSMVEICGRHTTDTVMGGQARSADSNIQHSDQGNCLAR